MVAHRPVEHLKRESNPTVYKRLKRVADAKKNRECSICKPHRFENAERVPRRSWKLRRKSKWTKIKEIGS